MTLEKCIEYIDRYLNKIDNRPRLVDAQNKQALKQLKEHYQVGENKFLKVSDYSNDDETLKYENLLNDLVNFEGNVFLTEFVTYWYLEGQNSLQDKLNALLNLSLKCHLIILGYCCNKNLKIDDPRIENLIYTVGDYNNEQLPEIFFINPKLKISESCIDGINYLPNIIENNDFQKINVHTSKNKNTFPNSPFRIIVHDDAYEFIHHTYSLSVPLSRDYGREDNWEYALALLTKYKSWDNVFQKTFKIISPSYTLFEKWNDFTDNEKWLYFISLKISKSDNNYLNEVVNKTNDFNMLQNNILKLLIDFDIDNANFRKMYEDRKKILCKLKFSEDRILNYCNSIKCHEKNAIYYLTDLTNIEKEKIIECLYKYSDGFSHDELLNILKVVYEDLYIYMLPYNFGNELLNTYFEQYKYQKITNKIDDNFIKLVNEQAKKREYNLLLSSRAEILDSLDLDDRCCAYFVDAMGVEFLGYIFNKCILAGLSVNIKVGRSEIPTITEYNKDFETFFEHKNVTLKSVPDIDQIKHKGKHNYTFEKTKLPIHIISELEVLDDIINNINHDIINDICRKAILVADHGASRLVMLYNSEESVVQSNTKSFHGGRVCENTSDFDKSLSFATLSLDDKYYSSANYKRFAGGRINGVEMHGGATLEEVAIPIIEITHMTEDIEIRIQNKNIVSTFKNPPIIEFYTKTHLSDINVNINGYFYDVEYINNNKFIVKMPKRIKSGKYIAKVICKNVTIADNLSFEIVKGGIKNNDIL
jgi:hypothetical protein